MEQPLFCPKPSPGLKTYKEPFEEENNWAGKRGLCLVWTLKSLSSCPESCCHLLLRCPQCTKPFGSQPGVVSMASSFAGAGHMPLNLLPFLSPAPSDPAKRTRQLSSRLLEPRVEPCPETPTPSRKLFGHRKKARLWGSIASGATVVGLLGGQVQRWGIRVVPGDKLPPPPPSLVSCPSGCWWEAWPTLFRSGRACLATLRTKYWYYLGQVINPHSAPVWLVLSLPCHLSWKVRLGSGAHVIECLRRALQRRGAFDGWGPQCGPNTPSHTLHLL